jgi:maleamate amidohydrolase
MRDWMKVIPAAEMAMFKKAGFLANLEPGRRAALIVVDVTMGFCGSEGLTLDEAIKQFPTACGPSAWVAMPKIAHLVGSFRRANLPIVYTLSSIDDAPWAGKATKSAGRARPGFNDFPQAIAPEPADWQLRKTKASAFFQSPLSAYLTRERVDTLVFCGVSTSGCVRASVVDGFSHGFATFVVDDCCFDRSEFAHAANLLDMMAKYAVVQSLDEAVALHAPVPIAAE